MYARACCFCNRTVRTDKIILKGSVQPFTHHSSFSSKIIVMVFFMINICSSLSRLPASRRSTSEVDRKGQHDHSGSKTPRSVFIHPCCSSYMHEATRWFTCWTCGWKADWYGEGETGRLRTLASCLLSASCGAAWHGRLSQKIHTSHVCKLIQLFHHLKLDVWRRHQCAWIFCRTWCSFPAF